MYFLSHFIIYFLKVAFSKTKEYEVHSRPCPIGTSGQLFQALGQQMPKRVSWAHARQGKVKGTS